MIIKHKVTCKTLVIGNKYIMCCRLTVKIDLRFQQVRLWSNLLYNRISYVDSGRISVRSHYYFPEFMFFTD